MIYCADYSPIICPIGCCYAENTERLKREFGSDLSEFCTCSHIRNTSGCELTYKKSIFKGENKNG